MPRALQPGAVTLTLTLGDGGATVSTDVTVYAPGTTVREERSEVPPCKLMTCPYPYLPVWSGTVLAVSSSREWHH
jgi:hypothetical protein